MEITEAEVSIRYTKKKKREEKNRLNFAPGLTFRNDVSVKVGTRNFPYSLFCNAMDSV